MTLTTPVVIGRRATDICLLLSFVVVLLCGVLHCDGAGGDSLPAHFCFVHCFSLSNFN